MEDTDQSQLGDKKNKRHTLCIVSPDFFSIFEVFFWKDQSMSADV